MLLFTGVVLSLFLSFILLSKPKKTQADWILFLWLMTVAVNLILYRFHYNNTILQHPFIMGWIFPIPLLYWPLLYLYVSILTSKEKLQKKHLLHFIPFLLSLLMFTSFYVLPSATKIDIFKRNGAGYELEMNLNLIAIYLSAILYTIVSILKLKKYSVKIRNEFSTIEKINLNWVRYLIAGMTVILFVILYGPDTFIYYTVTVFIVFIGYFGIKQAGVFTQAHNFEENQFTIQNSDVIKYEKSTLIEESALNIQRNLTLVMKDEKLFKDPELTLDDLALKLNVPSYHLSQVINSLENKTFYEYINQLRIDEFCSLIEKKENKKLTLLAIALDCGFNSKSSFNRNFKTLKGITPSEYLKQQQERDS